METGSEKPGVAICSCNGRLRPVIKQEATDEDAAMQYTPIDSER